MKPSDLDFGNLSSALQAFMSLWMGRKVRTAMPGVIERYNSATRRAVVQPSLDVPGESASERRAQVANVPVLMPGNARWGLVFDLQRFDPVLLIWSQWGLARWKRGAFQRAEQGPLFDGTGCLAIPWCDQERFGDPSAPLEIRSRDGQTRISLSQDGVEISVPDGKDVRVGGDSQLIKADMIDALNAAISALNDGQRAELISKALYSTRKTRGQ